MRSTMLLLVLALAGCGDVLPARDDTCEVADVHGAVRCYNPHGICYVALDGVLGCQCNGDDQGEEDALCAEARGYSDAAGEAVEAPEVVAKQAHGF